MNEERIMLWHCDKCGLYSIRRAVFPKMEECRNCGYPLMDFVAHGTYDEFEKIAAKNGSRIF